MIKKKLLQFFSVIFLGFLLDQMTKHVIRLNFRQSASDEGGFYFCNYGIAWGIEVPQWFFLLSWLIVMGALSAWVWKKINAGEMEKLDFFACALIFSGALSNFFDRIIFGCVVDFIDLGFFPIFNLADIFISVGVFFWGLKIIKKA